MVIALISLLMPLKTTVPQWNLFVHLTSQTLLNFISSFYSPSDIITNNKPTRI
jgi:hypothetical protein